VEITSRGVADEPFGAVDDLTAELRIEVGGPQAGRLDFGLQRPGEMPELGVIEPENLEG
jgi:hypothetical protein